MATEPHLGTSAPSPSPDLQDLAAAATAYLMHRKAHEECVWTLRASVVVFVISLMASSALTTWVSQLHRVNAKPPNVGVIDC